MQPQTPNALIDQTAKAELKRRGSPLTAENLNRMKQALGTNREMLGRASRNSGNEERTAGRTTSGVELAQAGVGEEDTYRKPDSGGDLESTTVHDNNTSDGKKVDPFEEAISKSMNSDKAPESRPAGAQPPMLPPKTKVPGAPQPIDNTLMDDETGQSYTLDNASDPGAMAGILAALGVVPMAMSVNANERPLPAQGAPQLAGPPQRPMIEGPPSGNPRLGPPAPPTGPTGRDGTPLPVDESDQLLKDFIAKQQPNTTEKSIMDRLDVGGGDVAKSGSPLITNGQQGMIIRNQEGVPHFIGPDGNILDAFGKPVIPEMQQSIMRAVKGLY